MSEEVKPRDKQVLVAPELHYRLKVRAAEEGRPVKAVAEDAIVAYLEAVEESHESDA